MVVGIPRTPVSANAPTVVSRSNGIEQSAEARRASLKRSSTPIDTRDPEPGVPQILVPHLLDQHYWAQRVQLLGIGPPPVRRRTLTSDALADTITATLDNELVAERARLLGRRLRKRTGADPTVAFLANGSASGGSGRTQSSP
jgi:hypothetical protein